MRDDVQTYLKLHKQHEEEFIIVLMKFTKRQTYVAA
jgi:hypothetical protein